MRTPRTILQRLVTLYDNEETITYSDWCEARASLMLKETTMTPCSTKNRKRHTRLRLASIYSAPWLLLGGVLGAIVGWLISLFN